MPEADFIKTVDFMTPDGGSLPIDIFKDPRTGRYFGIESAYADSEEVVVLSSPYNHQKLSVIAM